MGGTCAVPAAFFPAMQDARTYRQYAEECRKLAEAMPQHRANLLDMASVWANLAEKAEAKEKGASQETN
jgi:hypothetical protein